MILLKVKSLLTFKLRGFFLLGTVLNRGWRRWGDSWEARTDGASWRGRWKRRGESLGINKASGSLRQAAFSLSATKQNLRQPGRSSAPLQIFLCSSVFCLCFLLKRITASLSACGLAAVGRCDSIFHRAAALPPHRLRHHTIMVPLLLTVPTYRWCVAFFRPYSLSPPLSRQPASPLSLASVSISQPLPPTSLSPSLPPVSLYLFLLHHYHLSLGIHYTEGI